MQLIVTVLTLYMLRHGGSVIIDAASIDSDITVELTDDPRGINEITVDNYWKMNQSPTNPLYDWGLKMKLDSKGYAFQSGQESTLTIEMDGFCQTNECDGFYAFSVGDQYITFVHDFDGRWWLENGINSGIYVYPACGTDSIATGDASQIYIGPPDQRHDLAGGDKANWYQLTSSPNGRTFPVTFEFINDDITDTFTFRFKSATFPSGLECVYNSAMPTAEDFNFYFTLGTSETINIQSFDISGENIGTACDCYETELLSVTTDEDDGRCYLYQASFCDDELDSIFLERNRAVETCGADIVSLMTSYEPTDLSFFVKPEGIEGIYVNGLSDGDIFRFCFDSAQVIGTTNGGVIEYYKDTQRYVCPVANTLPNLCAGGSAAHSVIGMEEQFGIGDGNKNKHTVNEQLMMIRLIWSAVTALFVSMMVVFIGYYVCIKPKVTTSIYMKVLEDDKR